MNKPFKSSYTFGEFRLDIAERQLMRSGEVILLAPKVFDTLLLLVENSGHLVRKEEFMNQLWPGTFVGEDALARNISVLRKALGKSRDSHALIVTVPKRGYRFVGTVREVRDSEQDATEVALSGTTDFSSVHLDVRADRQPHGPQANSGNPGLDFDLKRRARRPWGAAAGVVAVSLAAIIVWVMKRQPPPVPDLKLRQITINSPENPVANGAISPDGKYLAYTDKKGMHIMLIETGVTQAIPQPESFQNENIDWFISPTTWFPDNTRFLANAHPPNSDGDATSRGASIWVVSVLGGSPRKIRDNSVAWTVSSDGAVIYFGTNPGQFGDREFWQMGPEGEQARKIYDAEEGSGFGGLIWLSAGKRVIYFRTDEAGDTLSSRDLNGGPTTTLLSTSVLQKMADLTWLPDGRLLYAVRDAPAVGEACNYWTVRLNARTGQMTEKPSRLTNWTGFCLNYSSVTSDGKRLAFLEQSTLGTGYVADLEAGGTGFVNSRPFPLEEAAEGAIADWSADGKTVIVTQNRGDHYSLRKQGLRSDNQDPVLTSAAGLLESAMVSPDDKWVIAQVQPMTDSPSSRVQLTRVPITGGSPEVIFSMPEWSSSKCAKPPSKLCAVAEQTDDHKQMVITSFDPVKGRGSELTRFDLGPEYETRPMELLWSISLDGTRLAAARGTEGPIQIRSLSGGPGQIVRAKNLSKIRQLEWAADGNGLIVSSGKNNAGEILHVNLQGDSKVLWKCNSDSCSGSLSPDGRHLAINERRLSANMWMMENF